MAMTLIGSFKRSAHLLVWAACILLLFSHVQARPSQDPEPCKLGEHTYSLGERWNPKLGERMTCVNCTCLEGGLVECKKPQCPQIDCDEPRQLQGECCPTCDDLPNSLTPALEEEDGSDLEDDVGCDYEGKHYELHETFRTKQSMIKPNKDNQCVLCQCMKGGQVICALETCWLRPGCRNVDYVPRSCCPVCVDDEFFDEDLPLNSTLADGDCRATDGQRVRNGSSWRPSIPSFGEHECVTCTCMDGKLSCERMKCPDDSSLPCPDPRPLRGRCCKGCPGQGQGQTGGGGGGVRGKKKPKKDRKERKRQRLRKMRKRCRRIKTAKGRRKCIDRVNKKKKKLQRRTKDNRSEQTTPPGNQQPTKFKPEARLSDVISQLCMPKNTERLVYQSKTDKVQTLTFDGPQDNRIEHFKWRLKKGLIRRSGRRVVVNTATAKFRRHVRVGDILGAVRKKDVRRFLGRIKRKMDRCKAKRKCRRKLLDRSVSKLKIRPLDLTRSCSPGQ